MKRFENRSVITRMDYPNDNIGRDLKINEIAQAIHVINRRAKVVPDSSALYSLKYAVIKKLLLEQRATKLCVHRFKRVHQLHSIRDSRIDIQTIFVVVSCGEYTFHYPAEKQDIKDLKFEKKIVSIRNPRSEMSYASAKRLLLQYLQ
ncbi:hypothetical protein H9635_18385 [Solibacillus sp. A46]|uniref:Uncharacterized protein n=1 Tax=Solibacillus faecavium TaxID=2762221 RepID=A0ABR8Y3B9_9BACL|nr:YkyB family protein [Solibacillus faecavium]MBD8038716.1 hypothetical protein [Solibacillus faecavium]